MQIAVITPYYKEPPELLWHGHQSVIRQSHPCRQVMVADGHPHDEVSRWPVDHVVLPRSHGDIGSTPRLIGCFHAIGLGYDAVAFLDADNWYREDHIASLVRLIATTPAVFVTSGRMLCRLDGSSMSACTAIHPDKFVDTNCMMFTRPIFHLLATWVLMPSYGHLIGDRIMLHQVKASGVQRAHNPEPTVFYRCGKEGIYRALGEPIPPGVAGRPNYESAFQQWVEDGNPPLI